MKTIRIAMMVATLSLGATTVVHAQDSQPRMQRGGRGMNVMMLLQGITLTPQQQVKIDSLKARYDTEDQQMRAEMQSGGDRQAMMGKMREARQKRMEEIKAVLDEEQKKAFDKNVEDMRSRMPQQRPPSL